jgi:hypothetical protein
VIFKKGDLVTFKKSLLGGSPVSNKIGIVQSVHSFREISGSNGDFFTERHYRVLFGDKVWRCHERSLSLVSRS